MTNLTQPKPNLIVINGRSASPGGGDGRPALRALLATAGSSAAVSGLIVPGLAERFGPWPGQGYTPYASGTNRAALDLSRQGRRPAPQVGTGRNRHCALRAGSYSAPPCSTTSESRAWC